MNERRFVVEITRPVPADTVAEVSAEIAGRLDMDPQRIVTLLSGRVGAVTKAVLPDKAAAIAEVFEAAGVHVVVVPAAEVMPELASEPVREPANVYDADAYPVEEAQDAIPGDAAEEAAPPIDPHAVCWDATPAWKGDEPSDWSALRPHREGAGLEAHTDRPAGEATGPQERTKEAAPSRNVEPEPVGTAAGEEATPTAEEPPGHAPWRFRESDPALEEEADQLGPRVPAPGASLFSTSTRWVPSPHDEYGFDGEEVPLVADGRDLEEQWNEGRMTSAGRGFGPRAGTWADDSHSVEPPREGPRLRTFLMWGLIVSIVVFLLLQFVMADRARAGPEPTDYAAGLLAFRRGDFHAAMRAWEPEAAQGNASAQYYLGYMVQNGLGQPWSNAKAAAYYLRAAEGGLPEAQLALGDLYLRGMGVEQDEAHGAALYAQAAGSGDPRGRYEYGKLLMHGKGVERDPVAALAQFEAAAAAGLADAADLVAFAREAVGVRVQPAPPAAP